jgi:hypothetical protein
VAVRARLASEAARSVSHLRGAVQSSTVTFPTRAQLRRVPLRCFLQALPPTDAMRRCDCHSGVSIGAALHRCRKGHPEVFRNDRKTDGTSAVPEQRRRTSDPDADLRQWMRDHRRQRPVCRGCSRGSVARSTATGTENFTISDAAGEMTRHGTSPRKYDLSVLLPAAGGSLAQIGPNSTERWRQRPFISD